MSWGQLLFSFEGRIGRAPYWYFVLATAVLYCLVVGIAGASLYSSLGAAGDAPPSAGMAGVVLPLLTLVLLWPSLAICAKRWHDIDKSAWWILIALVPVVGGLVALIFNGFIAGTPGPNRFGNPPTRVVAAA